MPIMRTDRAHPEPEAVTGLPAAAARLLAEAGSALSRMQPGAAERSLISVLAVAPRCVEANRLMGIACHMNGDHAQAIDFLRRALAERPHDPVIQMNLGSALHESGAVDAALEALRRACELAPNFAAAWYNLGKALKLQVQTAHACDALRRALKIDPAHVAARITLADAQISLGEVQAAIANYREILRRHPDNPEAWFALANLKTEPLDTADTARLQRLFRQSSASTDARISIGFALAKALEDQRDYAAAFEVLRASNGLKRQQVRWNDAVERARVDAIMAAFAAPMSAPQDATMGREVIFIVSLPRSGSTLAEQILASHPEVEGANEITDLPSIIEDESKRRGQPFPQWAAAATSEDWWRLGRDYLARTARWRRRRPRSTDKNLVSWQLVGAVFAMLPAARVVNCRRDPLETCFACYRQLFSNGAHFSYDPVDMVNHYQDYDRLMRYWQHRYPGQALEHQYEALLLDPEYRIRQLLDFCGLTFDPACLAFHETQRTVVGTASAAQVRRPLSANTSYAARYGRQLDPWRELLGATSH
ncbi:MAG: sulfotransferase [Rhodanobacter sp.]